MKFLCILIFTLAGTAALFSQSRLDRDRALGQEKKSILRKTEEAVGKVTQKVTEPIRDPKAAFSYWFDFDPGVTAGEKKNYNLLPLFVSSPERGQGFGLKYAQESLLRKSDVVRIQAIQTLKGKSAVQLKYELPPELIAKVGGEFEISYKNFSRFYYGLGNKTPKENESEYTPEFFEAKLPLLYGITDTLFAGLSLHFQNWKITNLGEAGILQEDLPNLSGTERIRIYSTSLLFRWDRRNSKTDPSRGHFLEGGYEYAKKVLGSEADFNRAFLEARSFFSLFQKNDHIFGARLFVDYKNGEVPFYLLPELGGIFFNRGLIEGRFRDILAITATAEYRLKIYQRLHWAFFLDAGNVYSGFNKISFAHTKITGGTGMRYYVPPGNLLLARVDADYSAEGLQIYLTFDHPF